MSADLAVEALQVGAGPVLDLHAGPGTITALLGGPGSGKSALLGAIVGHRRATAGSVLLGGVAPEPGSTGVMGQPVHLFRELTVVENMAVPVLARNRPFDQVAAERVLAALLLGPATWHNLVEQLSGGQQQRVAVARALVTGSPLLCLDEPVNELDEASAAAVWTALRTAAHDGAIVLVATSDPELAERCDRVVRLPS